MQEFHKNKSRLLTAFCAKLEQGTVKDKCRAEVRPILCLDEAFLAFQREVAKIEIHEKRATIDESFFELDANVDDLYRNAVGCRATCIYCGRKCELPPHNHAEMKHNCDTVGH